MNEVRKKRTFIPELSLAEDDDRKLGGEPDFYHRFGFKGSYEYNIFHVAV